MYSTNLGVAYTNVSAHHRRVWQIREKYARKYGK